MLYLRKSEAMKKTVFIIGFCCLFLFSSCRKQLVFDGNLSDIITKSNNDEQITASYFPVCECWIEPDSVFLQKAFRLNHLEYESESYRNLIMRNQITHLAVKFLPNSLYTHNRLFCDSTIITTYIPFGYKQIPDQRIWNSASNFIGESDIVRDTVIYPNRVGVECCIDDSERRYAATPIYAIWPVERPLPGDIPYELLYGLNYESDDLETRGKPINITPWTFRLYCYDPVLEQNVPLRGAQVSIYELSVNYSYFTQTNANGSFTLPLDAPYSSEVRIWLNNDYFYVCRDSTFVNVGHLLGIVDTIRVNNTYLGATTDLFLGYNYYDHVYQAAWYYYNGSNSLLQNSSQLTDLQKIRINVNLATYAGGMFHWNETPPSIDIWDTGLPQKNYVLQLFCNVLHELGHGSHFQQSGKEWMQSSSWPLIESYATLYGWYNTVSYYASASGDSTYNTFSYGQGKQNWQYVEGTRYTPFYVDLHDDYNQHMDNTSYVEDCISGVPMSTIVNSAVLTQSLQGSFDYLLTLGGMSAYQIAFDNMATYYYPYIQ